MWQVKRYLTEERRRELDQWLGAVSAHSVSAEGEGVASRSGLDEIKVRANDMLMFTRFVKTCTQCCPLSPCINECAS